MLKCKEIIRTIEKIAPEDIAESWDNVGLIIASPEDKIQNIMLTLDVTLEVIREAIEKKVDLIISHHPMIFEPLKKINSDEYMGKMIYKLIKNNIAVYASHTNFDLARGGLNDILAQKLGLNNIMVLKGPKDNISLIDNKDKEIGLGRIGSLNKETTFNNLIENVKDILGIKYLKYVGNEEDYVYKVAVCTGSGADLIPQCIQAKVDVFITGDIKYHAAQLAKQNNLFLIDAGHYETENIIVSFLSDYLKEEFPHTGVNIFISQANPNIFKIK